MLRYDFYSPWFGQDETQSGKQPSADLLSWWSLQRESSGPHTRRTLSPFPAVPEFTGDVASFLSLSSLEVQKTGAQTVFITLICAHTWTGIKFMVSENKHGNPTEALLFCFPSFCFSYAFELPKNILVKFKKITSTVCFWRGAPYRSCELFQDWKTEQLETPIVTSGPII